MFDITLFSEANMMEKMQQIMKFLVSEFDFVLSELSKLFRETKHEILNGVDLSGCKAILVGQQLVITLPATMNEKQQKAFMEEFLNYVQRNFALTPEYLGLSKSSLFQQRVAFQQGSESQLTKEQQQTLQILKKQFNTTLKDLNFSTFGCKAEIQGKQLLIIMPDIMTPVYQDRMLDTFKKGATKELEELGLIFESANIKIQYTQKVQIIDESSKEEQADLRSKHCLAIPRCVPKGFE